MIFRSSKVTCAGYEIGWDFVETMMSMKCNFAGYCNIMNGRYAKLDKKFKFMSPPVFRDWFFAWASHMQVDFRSQCPGCPDNPKVLACDATKVGIKVAHQWRHLMRGLYKRLRTLDFRGVSSPIR